MINPTYMFLVWKLHRGLILFSFLFLALMQFLIIWIIGSLNYLPFIETFIQQLPPQIRILFSEELINRFSINGAAAFGFNHPLVLAVLGLSAIMIPARHIAGEVESGSLEIIISHPIKRIEIIFSLWLSYLIILLFIIVGGWIGSYTALTVKSQINLQISKKLFQIGLNLWLLFLLIMSYTLFISTFKSEGNKTGIIGAIITLLFYLMNFFSTIWDSLQFTKFFNIFTYYQPQKLMFTERSFWSNAIVLLTIIFICLGAGMFRFHKRDIP